MFKASASFLSSFTYSTVNVQCTRYVYVGVDDCWAKSRDPTTSVIQADPATFPSGMKALADYAHARGLKFGLYSSNSPSTCDGRPGSFGYETVDAQTYASWGVDLLKYDIDAFSLALSKLFVYH